MTARERDLRRLRLDKRLTQADAAVEYGVSQGYWSQIENGLKPREVGPALRLINRMRSRTSHRTEGGAKKAGRVK